MSVASNKFSLWGKGDSVFSNETTLRFDRDIPVIANEGVFVLVHHDYNEAVQTNLEFHFGFTAG